MTESWLGKSWELLSRSSLKADESEKHWRAVASFDAERVRVSSYVSKRTGLRLMMAQVPGPLVNGYFTVATEARQSDYARPDDGLPHTLEHLVFMGSEQYPFKGVIDQLAGRSLAQGTNAWTDVDHTAFTLTTAGPQGFLSMLPVFLDHILFPSLSDAAFLTEVHHLAPDGFDSGVVYTEMEGRQSTPAEVCRQRLLELIYPEGSGYRSATGGRVENLRELSNEAVRRYHAQYYRPDNLCVIITGQVEAREVMRRLEGMEHKLMRCRAELPPLARPWFNFNADAGVAAGHEQRAAPPGGLLASQRVFFPADDEATGVVMMGWEAPPWHEFEAVLCIRIMWLYLADTAASPLQRALVEGERPLCSSISFVVQEGMPGSHYVHFEKADAARLDEIHDVFMATVRREVTRGPDMKRIRSIIQREKLRHLCAVEEDPHNTFAGMLLYAFLYGDRDGASEEAQLKDRVQNTVSRMEALPVGDDSQEAKAFWSDVLRRNVLEPPRGKPTALVTAAPSGAMAREQAEAEARRRDLQMAKLTPDVVEELTRELDAATEENGRPCPADLVESYPTPEVSQVPGVPVVSVRNLVQAEGEAVFEVLSTYRDADEPLPDPAMLPSPRFVLREPSSRLAIELARKLHDKGLGSEGELPFMVQWDHIPSAFAEVTVWFETSSLPDHLRPMLELLFEVIFELPVRQDDGTLWTQEEVVKYLAADTVSFSNAIGTGRSNFYCGIWGQAASLTVKVEGEKYWLAVKWLRNLLYRTEVCVELVRAAAQRLVGDIARLKRDGMSMCSALMRAVNFDAARSNHAATSLRCQHAVLHHVLQRLRTHPASVVSDLENLLRVMTHPDNLRVHVACDMLSQPDPVRPWVWDFQVVPHSRDPACPPVPRPVLPSRHLRTAEAVSPTGKGFLLSSTSMDGGYLMQCVPVDMSYDDRDYAAVLVADEYLMGVEGDLWKRIKGLNLALGYELTCSPEQGLLSFSIYRAADLTAAYSEAHEVVMAYASGAVALEGRALEAAKSSVMFEYLDRVWTGPTASEQAFLNYFRGTPQTFCADLIVTIMSVTADDVLSALNAHLVRLFDPNRSTIVICCHSSKALRVKHDFVRCLGRPQLETSTVDRYFNGGRAEEEGSDSCSASETSEASLAQLASLEATQGSTWLKVGSRNQGVLVAACAMAGLAWLIVGAGKKGSR